MVKAPRRKLRQGKKRKGIVKLRSKKMRKAMAKIARSEISRMAEDKTIRNNSSFILFNDPETSNWRNNNVFDTMQYIRSITQGVGQGNRVGNKITIKKFTAQYLIWPWDRTTNLFVLKMWIVTDKFNPYNSEPADIQGACIAAATYPLSTWFENGNTTSGMTKVLADTLLPMNLDRFRVHKTKTFKLGYGTGPAGTTVGLGNNDFKTLIRFTVNLKKYMPKKVTFADTNVATFNRKVFVVFAVVKHDNSAPNPEDPLIGMQRVVDFRYEDI